jgi:hypothetical protein
VRTDPPDHLIFYFFNTCPVLVINVFTIEYGKRISKSKQKLLILTMKVHFKFCRLN